MADIDQEPIRLSIIPNLDDWWAFQKELCQPGTGSGPSKRRAILFVASLASFVLFFEATRHRWFGLKDLLLLFGGPTLVLMLMVLNTARIRARITPAADGSVLLPWELELRADGLRAVSARSDSLIFWAAVREIRETPDHLFLMTDTCTGVIVPKRAMGDVGMLERIRAFARAKLTPGK